MATDLNIPLWQGEEFADALSGRIVGQLPPAISGISIDSRTLEPGEAFFAIEGERFDGHDFVTAAQQAGAGVLVVDRKKIEKLRHLTTPLVLVDDVLVALEALARAARARVSSEAKIIAVTGSVGKTTIKESLRVLLATFGKTHANPASFNNHWGVPLTLARMPKDTDFAIFEIGMNHAGEIRPLVKMVRPHLAIISCVAEAHRAAFPTMADIAAAKAEIFDGVEKAGGCALLNADDVFFPFLQKAAQAADVQRIFSFGAAQQADYRLITARLSDKSSQCEVSLRGAVMSCEMPMAGRHMVQNMLAILGGSHLVGADAAHITHRLSHLTPPPGRGVRYRLKLPHGGTCTLIDESYNANPTSMRAALAVLGQMTPEAQGRRIAVLGDMLELGQEAKDAHEALSEPLKSAGVDKIFLTGQNMRFLAAQIAPICIWRETVQELQASLFACLREGDIITIKSSNGVGTSKIVAALLQQFPQYQ